MNNSSVSYKDKSNTSPKVSVVIAVFNSEKTIKRTIESILRQTYKDWELVVVDDCSSDSTFEIVLSYVEQDIRIRAYRNDQNFGLAASLNRGISAASADLIARIDDDDEMLPHRLEKQVLFMETYLDIGVLGSGAYLVDASGNTLGLTLQPETHNEIYEAMKRRNPIMHPTTMIRRSLLLKYRYSSALRRQQDYELWSRLIRETSFHNIQEPLINYCANYKKPISTILSGFYVSCLVALRFRSWVGIFSSFTRFITNILIRTNMHTPKSVKQT